MWHARQGGLFVGPDIFSFPSGHSSRAMLLAHVSIFVFGWQSPWRAASGTPLLLSLPSLPFTFSPRPAPTTDPLLLMGGRSVMCWAALVAVSRLALGRHFLTDVMGGLTLGALEFWATFLFLQRFVFTA